MLALVTGGGGFLGRRIVKKLLDRKDRVRIFSRSDYPELTELGCESHRGDLRNQTQVMDAVKNVDIVFHVAALAGIWGEKNDYFSVNVDGTLNIINACLKHKVNKLVYTSSPSVIFGMKDINNGNETLPYPDRFYAHYPHSKAIAEKIVLESNSVKKLSTCSLRPHLIWGPGDPHIIPMLIKKAKNKSLAQVGTGKNIVDITFVDNAADAHILAADNLAADSPVAGQSYFIGDQQPVNLWEWINLLLKQFEIPPIRKTIPYSAAYGIGTIMECLYSILPTTKEPKMTRFLAAQFALSHYYSHEKAKQDFGYIPSVSNEEGLKKTVAWLNSMEPIK